MIYTYFDTSWNKNVTVNIPDDYIRKNCHNLNISTQEAIDMWLSDEGYVTNDVVEELTAKAKQNPINHDVTRKSRKAPKRKPDFEKQTIMQALLDTIENSAEIHECGKVTNIELTNIERIVSFHIGENEYTITLSKKRK